MENFGRDAIVIKYQVKFCKRFFLTMVLKKWWLTDASKQYAIYVYFKITAKLALLYFLTS